MSEETGKQPNPEIPVGQPAPEVPAGQPIIEIPVGESAPEIPAEQKPKGPEAPESTEKEPAMRINEKGLTNSYLEKHLMGKGISLELIKKCLTDGVEVTDEIKHKKEGCRYFKLEMPDGAGLPGRFVLPELDGPLAENVVNWNCSCEFKFRHGKLAPIINRDQLPEWLVDYASVLYTIIEKNQLPDGKLQVKDGPTEDDPEGSWLVSTSHFGPPSRQKPRIPRDCSDPKIVKQYLEDLDSFDREQARVLFVDLETGGQVGPSKEPISPADEMTEMRKMLAFQKKTMDELAKQVENLSKQSRNKK